MGRCAPKATTPYRKQGFEFLASVVSACPWSPGTSLHRKFLALTLFCSLQVSMGWGWGGWNKDPGFSVPCDLSLSGGSLLAGALTLSSAHAPLPTLSSFQRFSNLSRSTRRQPRASSCPDTPTSRSKCLT